MDAHKPLTGLILIEHSQNMAAMLLDLVDEESQDPEVNSEEKHEFWVGTDDKNVDSQNEDGRSMCASIRL